MSNVNFEGSEDRQGITLYIGSHSGSLTREQWEDLAKKVAAHFKPPRRKKQIIPHPVKFPFTSDRFLKSWDHWKEYKLKEKRFIFASQLSEQAALDSLAIYAKGDEQRAIAIIYKAIGCGWTGLHSITDKDYAEITGNPDHVNGGQRSTGTAPRATFGGITDKLNRRFGGQG